MDTPTDEAVQTYIEYFRRDTSTCRFLPFLKDLIYFFVDEFDTKIDADALPTAATEETILEENVRIQVVDQLLDEFKDNFDDPLGKPFCMEEEEFEGYVYVKIVDVFYFCLSRRQRQPSNLSRNPSIKTAKEQRDEDWKVHIEDRHRQAKRGVRKSIRRAQNTSPFTRLVRNSSIETAGRIESDSRGLAADEANSGSDRPVRQTELVLERKPSGSDMPIEAKLPRPLELSSVNRREFSEHLLMKVYELHSERYGEVLERHPTVDICAKLESNVTPGVRLISDRGLFSLAGYVIIIL
jgi:hypothetical protein